MIVRETVKARENITAEASQGIFKTKLSGPSGLGLDLMVHGN